ncbi:MAG: YggT family protein [Luminiphilus sp.]|jgi:YggT family protein|nr:YggT family protein [Luminiphilus sp.]
MGAGTEISLYLVRNLGALLLLMVVMRGVLHTSRVNFYNPISQLIVRLTNPLLAPFRNFLPAAGRVDWAVVVLAVLVQSLILLAITVIAGDGWATPGLPILLVWGVIGVLGLLINLYFFILIAMIIISWVAPGSRHPAIELIWQVSEPVMAPVRSLLPNMGGIDFSPILLFIIINVVQIGLRHLAVGVGLPPGLVFGL